jgi:hypothetical protein
MADEARSAAQGCKCGGGRTKSGGEVHMTGCLAALRILRQSLGEDDPICRAEANRVRREIGFPDDD